MGPSDGEVRPWRGVRTPGAGGNTSTAGQGAFSSESSIAQPLALCAALATGAPVRVPQSAWSAVFARIQKERCGPLAWLRSRAIIERDAPREITAQWSALVDASAASTAQQLEVIDQIGRWTRAHGVRAIIMKGLPLAYRLYREVSARPASDVDLYVAAPDRDAVADILGATGWRLVHGKAPDDQQFAQVVGRSVRLIEIHSSLAGPWMSHLRFPEPEVAPVSMNGMVVDAHGGSFLPAYLASHLLHHDDRPLLWLVDFATLWDSLNDEQRVEARAAARSARLHRVLEAAVAWGAMLAAIASAPSTKTVEHFEHVALARRPGVVIRQLLRYSAHPLDAAKILGHLIWPRELRAHRGGFTRLWRQRLLRRLGPRRAVARASRAS